MINSLRNAREKHPAVDTAVESLPIVGALGAGLDITDPNASNFTKTMALASIVPGGKLAGVIAKRLRGLETRLPAKVVDKLAGAHPPAPDEITFTPEEIFSNRTKPEVVKSANDAYIKQLLEEEANRYKAPEGYSIREHEPGIYHALDAEGNKIGELGTEGEIPAWVDVDEGHRRKGIASALFEAAQKDNPNFHHGTIQTTLGEAWSDGRLNKLVAEGLSDKAFKERPRKVGE